MVPRSLLWNSTCSDARSAACCQGDYCTSGGRMARDLANPRVSLSLNLIFPSAIVLPVTHHGNPAVMTSEAGSHYAPPDSIFCVAHQSDKWLSFFSQGLGVFLRDFTGIDFIRSHVGRFYCVVHRHTVCVYCVCDIFHRGP